MFTGLIKAVGRVAGKRHSSNGTALTFHTALARELALGDSVAVNGVCLTASRLADDEFTADIMPETWKGTNLSRLRIGDPVNLEPALAVGERFGGHMVSGHVDGLGRISRITREHNAVLFQIMVPSTLGRWLIRKGSIAVNGVSLTIQQVIPGGFVISLIPHTLKETTFQTVKVGDWVNLETDQLLKLSATKPSDPGAVKTGITEAFLAEHGFLD